MTATDEIDLDTLGCKPVVDEHELSCVPGPTETTMHVHDCDGGRLFTVSRSISPYDLNAMLKFANVRYRLGVKDGRNEVRRQLKNLVTIEE